MNRTDFGIALRSHTQCVTEIIKPTKARLFKDFRPGTIFRLSMRLVPTAGGANGNYALCVVVTNKTTGEKATFTQNEVLRYLACFQYSRRGAENL